jgi:hypothetical protein
MKKFNFRTLAGLLLVLVLFGACDKLEEADDITFDVKFTLPKTFEVTEEADEPANPYTSLVSTMDIDNPEFDVYKDKIKDVKVNKIEYTISSFAADEPVTMTLGEAIFFGVGETIATGQIASVSSKALSNHTGELTASASALEKIEKIILEDGEVFVASRCNLTAAPVFFNVNVTVYVTVTANALK